MKKILLGNNKIEVPSVIVGCMRFSEKTVAEMNRFIHQSLENGINFFDHADIYGKGVSEEIFGKAICDDSGIKRENLFIQSKCGINNYDSVKHYDLSKEYIINAVDGSLKRLKTDYLDSLLLHRPDALVEPEEVAEAFDELKKSGKVRYFGVSNHKPMQIELLKKYLNQDLIINQLQFSIPACNMISNGIEVNMYSNGAIDRDGSVLDYSRLHDITIQAWSPFQMPEWRGCFIDSDDYADLNWVMGEMAANYGVSKTAIATAWILRHPANMQVIAGTTNEERLKEIIKGSEIKLTRAEWYNLYQAAGNMIP